MKYVIFMALMLGTASLILLSGLVFPTVIALTVLVSAVILDFYTTLRCLREKGREGNPVVALLFRKVGVYKTFGLMVILWICFIMFRWIHEPASTQTAVAIIYWYVPVNNMMVLRRLKRQKVVS